MSRGKYSPNLPKANCLIEDFKFNSKGEMPTDYEIGMTYDTEIHGCGFGADGFDMYGYSSYDETGKFVGDGEGIDRNGYTSDDYMMSDDAWADGNGF